MKEIYEKQCTKEIERINNKLKIIMDNDFAQAMMNRLKKCAATYVSDFAKLESNVVFINFLCQVMLENKFITSR